MKDGTANTIVISFKASSELRDKIRAYAAANHKRQGEVIREAVKAYLNSHEQQ